MINGFNNNKFATTYDINARMLSMLNKEAKLALYWTKDVKQFPYYIRASPLRDILYWWSKTNKLQMLHSASVGVPQGGVLLVGKGGSGKSTTAISCINSNFSYAGDDYCLMTSDPIPMIYSLYNSAKLNFDSIKRFPNALNCVNNKNFAKNNEKAVLFIHKLKSVKISSSFPVKALLLPCVSNKKETSIEKISSATGLQALAPSSIFQLPGATQDDFLNISNLVRKTPSYVLKLGSDFDSIPYKISELIKRI